MKNQIIHIFNVLLLILFASTASIGQHGPVSQKAEVKRKKYRIIRTVDKARTDILGGGMSFIVDIYKYNSAQPPEMRFTAWMTFYLARMAIVQPEKKIPYLDEMTVMTTLGIESIKKCNSQGPLAEKVEVAEEKASISLFNKKYQQAIDHYTESNKWRKVFSETFIKKKYNNDIYILNSSNARILQLATRVEIIKKLIARKKGKEYNTDPHFFSQWKLNNFYEEPQPLQDYMGFLIAFNRLQEFKEIVLFDLNRGPDYSTLFYCREIGNIYFDWFAMHDYWLTPEFRKQLASLRKLMNNKLKFCFKK